MRRLASAALLALLAAPASVRAAPEAPRAVDVSRADAQRAMERGVMDLSLGRWEAALALFREAQRLAPDANLPYRFEGEALERLGRWEEAIVAYQKYLKVKPEVSDAGAIKERIASIRAQRLEGRLDLRCEVNAEVFLDERSEPTGTLPLDPVTLGAGSHRLVLRADGYKEQRAEVQIEPGRTAVMRCKLDRMSADVTVPAPAPAAPPSRAPVWIAWSATGVLAAGAVVTGVLALTSSHALDRDTQAPALDERRVLDDQASVRRYAVVTDVLLGGVVLAGAIALYLTLRAPPNGPALHASR
jgi:tetratricopeptide (TPR) repeat protein